MLFSENKKRPSFVPRRVSVAAALALAAAVTSIAIDTRTAEAGAVRVDFRAMHFPPGTPGTATSCPNTINALGWCVIDPGEWSQLPGGRLEIRRLVLIENWVAWRTDGSTEPRKTGYDITEVNAAVDANFTGTVWGRWTFHTITGDLFVGRYEGRLENGIPALRGVGLGTGAYEGQQMIVDLFVEPQPWGGNAEGRVLEPTSSR